MLKDVWVWTGVLQKSNICENISSYTECLGWWLEEYLISPQNLIWWKILNQQG